ncbi:MAG: serine/threonine-protein kinase [Planctomycetota bacterium]
MNLADTLDLTMPSAATARAAASTGAMLSLETDRLLANVPTVRGFKVMGNAALYTRLGRGGSGAVYRARHLDLGIDVAVKCVFPPASKVANEVMARFHREVALTKCLDHPNVVQILGSGTEAGLPFLVMEYVHGETLRRRVRRLGALPWQEALAITKRAARGLGATHRCSLVHRDIKPDNLMIGREGEVKVCDLGLIKSQAHETSLTRAMSLLGTPRYMAPEQWVNGGRVGAWTDVHALGACLYFMLAGRDARTGDTLAALRNQNLEAPFPALEADVPRAVLELLRRCVVCETESRYQNGDQLADAIESIESVLGASLCNGGDGTVPAELRACGPLHAEERAMRRALGRRSRSLSSWRERLRE